MGETYPPSLGSFYCTKSFDFAFNESNYEGDGNGIFYVFIQVTDDQHLFGETFFSMWVYPEFKFARFFESLMLKAA